MYFNQSKIIKKKSYYGLIVAFCISILAFPFSQEIYAQAWQSDRVLCTLTADKTSIDFNNISFIASRGGLVDSGIMINCRTNYYVANTTGSGWRPTGTVCIGVSSLNANEPSDPRYLYLNGNPRSPYKMLFNYYSNLVSPSSKIGDGISTRGFTQTSLGAPISFRNTQPIEFMNINFGVNIKAVYSSNQSNLPVGQYSNKFLFTLHSGAGGTSGFDKARCSLYPNVASPLTMNVTAKVVPGCKFSVKQNINFGIYASINSGIVSSGQLGVQCNLATAYEILLDGGRNKKTSDRRMSLVKSTGSYDDTQRIGYNLYLPNTRINWGEVKNVDSYKGTGTGTEQIIKIDAQINPASNSRPVVGTYRDEIVATIIY